MSCTKIPWQKSTCEKYTDGVHKLFGWSIKLYKRVHKLYRQSKLTVRREYTNYTYVLHKL